MLILKRIFESENSRNTHGRISLYKLHSTSGVKQGILHRWSMMMTCMESFHWKPPEQGVAEWGRWLGLCCPRWLGLGGFGRTVQPARSIPEDVSRIHGPRVKYIPTNNYHFSCRWNLQCWTWAATKKTIRRLTKGDFGPQLLWRISPTHHPQCSGHQGFHMWSYKLNQKI